MITESENYYTTMIIQAQLSQCSKWFFIKKKLITSETQSEKIENEVGRARRELYSVKAHLSSSIYAN